MGLRALLLLSAAAVHADPTPAPPPFSCPSGGYCGSCPSGSGNWDSIHPMLLNSSPGLKQFHASVAAAVAMFRHFPGAQRGRPPTRCWIWVSGLRLLRAAGIRTDDAKDTHMTVQYLCCLNATQMATVRRVVAAHPFPRLAVHFGEVICRTASFIATVDAETQRTLGAWVDRVEDAIIAAGPTQPRA